MATLDITPPRGGASMPDLADRWRGALLGTAIGDAVGAPTEGASAVDEAEVRWWMTSSRPLRWTDDTAMTLGLARSLVERDGEVDPQHLGDTFAADHRAEPWRGYGAGPPKVFAEARRGTPYLEAAAALYDGGSFGNGAAMRAAPCAVAGGDDLDRVAELARQQAVVTHAHPLAQDGAVLMAVGTAAVAGTTNGDGAHAALQQALPHLRTDELHRAASLAMDRGAELDPREIGHQLGRDSTALESVPAAVAAFLGAPDDPEEVLVRATAVGGDTDTIAAMAGALVGARVGAAGLPDRLLDRLESRAELARQALTLAEVADTA